MHQIFTSTSSFENTFREFYPSLVVFANKQLHDLDASEDIVQDLFVYLFEKRHGLIINDSLRAYLFKAIFNQCKSYQRKQLTHERYEQSMKSSEMNEFRDLLTETEMEERVFKAINKLPERCKEIFRLSRFEDLSNDEIAIQLNISKRTVETQISKALKNLRSTLDPKTFYTFFI